MAKWNAGEAVVSIDNTSDALTDFSSDIVSVTLNETADSSQQGTLGERAKRGFVGKIAGSGSIVVQKDTDTSRAYYNLTQRLRNATYYGAAITMQIDEPDGTTGSLRYTGEVKITGVNSTKSGDSGDAPTAEFQFITDGNWTESVIA